MKVLVIMHDDDTYGAPRSMVTLCSILKEKYKVTPIVITPKRNKVNARCDKLNIENYAIPNWRYFVNRNRFFLEPFINNLIHKILDIFFYSSIAKKVDFSQIDIIHSAVSVVSHGQELSKIYNIPHIWHLRELDPYKDYFTQNQISSMGNLTNQFIAISNCVKEYWTKVGLPENKISVVYNGIDYEKIRKKSKYKEDNSKLNFVLAGRINPNKQIDIAIKALSYLSTSELDSIQLDIFGDSTFFYRCYLKKLKKMVKHFGLDNVVFFKGYDENINEKLCNYDVAIMSSKAEAFGRTTVEYMFAGIPVIATDTGANKELINDGIDGFIFRDGNEKELADKLVFFINNQELIKKLGESARNKALEQFTAEKNASSIYDIYQGVLNKK